MINVHKGPDQFVKKQKIPFAYKQPVPVVKHDDELFNTIQNKLKKYTFREVTSRTKYNIVQDINEIIHEYTGTTGNVVQSFSILVNGEEIEIDGKI